MVHVSTNFAIRATYPQASEDPVTEARIDLTKNARIILFSLYACEKQSAPEDVLRLWFSEKMSSRALSQSTQDNFCQSIEELSSSRFLKPSGRPVATNWRLETRNQTDQAWKDSEVLSLQSGNEALIQKTLEDDNFIFGVPRNPLALNMRPGGLTCGELRPGEVNIAKALRTLYFDPDHPDSKVRDAKLEAWNAFTGTKSEAPVDKRRKKNFEKQREQCDVKTNDCGRKGSEEIEAEAKIREQKRKAILPIVWVFRKYICENQLDAAHICELLRKTIQPPVQLATLSAVQDMFAIPESLPSVNEDNLGFLNAVLDIVRSNDDSPKCVLKAASKALLSNFKWEKVLRAHLLATLVRSIQTSLEAGTSEQTNAVAENRALRTKAARVLKLLASGGDETSFQMANADGVLASLVTSLNADDIPDLQQAAAEALDNLADGNDDTKILIMRAEGALKGIVSAFTTIGKPSLLQHTAARTLWKMTDGGELVKPEILAEKGAVLAGLVSALSESNDSNCCLQEQASGALACLAKGKEDWKDAIVSQDGAIPTLVRSLSRPYQSALQMYASGALKNLARGGEAIKVNILKSDGPRVLSGLINCVLQAHDNPALGIDAVKTLRELSQVSSYVFSVRLRIKDGKWYFADCQSEH